MIIIPTYNEKENIPKLVGGIRQNLPKTGILFVDDNSPDGTAEIIRELKQKDPGIFLISRARKLGLGSAYLSAFDYLIRNTGAEFAVTMDADLSHDPAVLPEIISKLEFYPVVIGSRYVSGGRVDNWSFFRRSVSRFGNLYAETLINLPINDLTSGLVGYRIEWLRRLDFSKINSEGYAFQIEMKHRLHGLGAGFFEHPITFIERNGGKSKFSSSIALEGMKYPLKEFFKRVNIFKND